MISTIKANIKSNLDDLVTDETLRGATTSDIRKNPLAADIAGYPHAFLMPPAVESEVNDNRSMIRSYTFDIMVLFNAENLSSTTEVEETIEGILDKFDNDPTLGGAALGGVLPVSSAPEPFQHNGKDMIMAVVQITAKEHVNLNF